MKGCIKIIKIQEDTKEKKLKPANGQIDVSRVPSNIFVLTPS